MRLSDSRPDLLASAVQSASNATALDAERSAALERCLRSAVSAAARAVGMSRKSAYALLKRAGPESGFAKAWHAALAAGKFTACSTAVDRAIEGVEMPYFYRGIQRGSRRVYNDNLLIAALRYFRRDRDDRDIRGSEPS